MTELKKVVAEMQKQVGKCSQYCKHYRCPDEMYCDHPLSCDAEDIMMNANMGLDKLCIFWEGNIGHCKKHDVVFVGECPECATDHYYDWLNEQEER